MSPAILTAEGYRLLALAFRYPDEGLVDELAEAAIAPPPCQALAELAGLVDEDLPAAHGRLYDQAVVVSPYESAWLPVDKGLRIGQLSAFYEAFGVKATGPEHELPDHIGVELEFASVLSLTEELAQRQGEGEHAAVARHARQVLLTEHLSRWVPPFAQALTERAAHPFHRRLGELLLAFVAHDLEQDGLSPAGPLGALRPQEELPMSCPMAGGEA